MRVVFQLADMLKEVLKPRTTGKFVALNAEYVEIDYGAVREAAKAILPMMKEEAFDATIYSSHECHPQPHDADAAQWVFLIDCLNFSFWTDSSTKFQVRFAGKQYTGYFALCAAIIRAKSSGVPILDANFCASISQEQVEEIFESSTETKAPLLQKRVEVIREFGTVLLEKFDGKFENLIKQCKGDAVKLVDLIEENFACFRDGGFYQGTAVKFLKRAQIVVADIHACFHGKDLGHFRNIEELTTFADYRIPQCLVYWNILKYKPELVEILDKEIESGSVYEVEIRGTTIHAVDALVEALNKLAAENPSEFGSVTLNAIVVDFFLWEFARKNKEAVSKMPFHRVRSHLY